MSAPPRSTSARCSVACVTRWGSRSRSSPTTRWSSTAVSTAPASARGPAGYPQPGRRCSRISPRIPLPTLVCVNSQLSDKRVLVTGGTGSLGRALVRRLLSGELGAPASVTVFSRDEAKQHQMRLDFQHRSAATDDVRYDEQGLLRFRIGGISDLSSVSAGLRDADVVFLAAGLKQAPAGEYQPFEAVKTNILGAQNIVQAIRDQGLAVETVIG